MLSLSHPGLLVRRVRFGVAEDEPDVFGELYGILVISSHQCLHHCAQVHGCVYDVSVVLHRNRGTWGQSISLTVKTDGNRCSGQLPDR